jgi:hypothetical protein
MKGLRVGLKTDFLVNEPQYPSDIIQMQTDGARAGHQKT